MGASKFKALGRLVLRPSGWYKGATIGQKGGPGVAYFDVLVWQGS